MAKLILTSQLACWRPSIVAIYLICPHRYFTVGDSKIIDYGVNKHLIKTEN